MALGDHQTLDQVSEQIGLPNEDWANDTWECRLMSDAYATAITYTTVAAFTEVSGGSYAAKSVTPGFSRSGSKSTFQASSVTWGVDASGPQDIRVAVLVNTTNNTPLDVVDLTADGTTPVDNQVVPINVNYGLTATVEVDR